MESIVIPPSPDRSDGDPNEATLDEQQQGRQNVAEASGWHPSIGGTVDTPCFALLAGIYLDSVAGDASGTSTSSQNRQAISIPLTHLPATLGRSHETNDESFFGLGHRKAVSRQQCCIKYIADAYGGLLGQDSSSPQNNTLVYQPPPAKKIKLQVVRPGPLPKDGFFVIECLGKNRILVDNQRVEQGQMALLKDGSKIRISSYYLYFLLPTIAGGENATTIQIPNPDYRKPPPLPAAKSSTTTRKQQDSDLDSATTQELLDAFFKAVEAGDYDKRRTKVVSGQIALHAVKAVARDEGLREKAAKSEDGGLARSDIVEWIEESDVFGKWMEESLTRVENATFQGKITKCLLAVGYVRSPESNGARVRYFLPPTESDEDDDINDDKSSGREEDDVPESKGIEKEKGGRADSKEVESNEGGATGGDAGGHEGDPESGDVGGDRDDEEGPAVEAPSK